MPEKDEIILIKYPMNGGIPKYHRAVVLVSLESFKKLIVTVIDAGEAKAVDLADCKSIDENVAKVDVNLTYL